MQSPATKRTAPHLEDVARRLTLPVTVHPNDISAETLQGWLPTDEVCFGGGAQVGRWNLKTGRFSRDPSPRFSSKDSRLGPGRPYPSPNGKSILYPVFRIGQDGAHLDSFLLEPAGIPVPLSAAERILPSPAGAPPLPGNFSGGILRVYHKFFWLPDSSGWFLLEADTVSDTPPVFHFFSARHTAPGLPKRLETPVVRLPDTCWAGIQPDGRLLFTEGGILSREEPDPSEERRLYLWKPGSSNPAERLIARPPMPDAKIENLVLSPDGKEFLMLLHKGASSQRRYEFWVVARRDGAPRCLFLTTLPWLRVVAWSPSRKQVLLRGGDKQTTEFYLFTLT
jgi:hypothetical protein